MADLNAVHPAFHDALAGIAPPRRSRSAIDACLADIARAARETDIRWRKHRARQMLHEPVLLDSAWEGLSALQPTEGVAECRRMLGDETKAWHRPNLWAALLAYRLLRRREARELAAMEGASPLTCRGCGGLDRGPMTGGRCPSCHIAQALWDAQRSPARRRLAGP